MLLGTLREQILSKEPAATRVDDASPVVHCCPVEIVSLNLGLGPDPRVLAISDFVEAPGPGVVLVDLNGQGMLYSQAVWMDGAGHVTEGSYGSSGPGWDVCDGCVSVTGRTGTGVGVVRVEVSSLDAADSFAFDVLPGPDRWYAGCRQLPSHWPGMEDVSVSVLD